MGAAFSFCFFVLSACSCRSEVTVTSSSPTPFVSLRGISIQTNVLFYYLRDFIGHCGTGHCAHLSPSSSAHSHAPTVIIDTRLPHPCTPAPSTQQPETGGDLRSETQCFIQEENLSSHTSIAGWALSSLHYRNTTFALQRTFRFTPLGLAFCFFPF